MIEVTALKSFDAVGMEAVESLFDALDDIA